MSPLWDFALWLYLVSKLLAHGCPSQMHHLGQMSSPRLLDPERNILASKISPPWDFAPWLYMVSKPLAHGRPYQMLLLGQMSSHRLLEPERKSLTSKMSPPWDIAPWLYLVSKFLANGCQSQILTPGQVLRSYILKPLRIDLTSIMSFILSLLIFGGQNGHDCVQTKAWHSHCRCYQTNNISFKKVSLTICNYSFFQMS